MRYTMLPVFLIGVTLSGQMNIDKTGDKSTGVIQSPPVVSERVADGAKPGTVTRNNSSSEQLFSYLLP